MIERPTSSHTLGLQMEGSQILMAEVDWIKNRPIIKRCLELSSEESLRWPKLSNQILTIASLPSAEVLIRSLEVKLKKIKEINEVLAFQAEPLLPYPIENAILDRQIVQTNSSGTTLTVFSAKKEHIQQTLERWNAVNLSPEVLSCSPAALCTFGNFFLHTDEPYLLVYLGQQEVVTVLISQAKIQAAQTLTFGIEALENAFSQDRQADEENLPENLDAVDFANISFANTPLLFEVTEQLKKDLLRISFSLDKQNKDAQPQTVFICGPGGNLSHLPEVIAKCLQKELCLPEAQDQIHLLQEELFRYSLPIGLALSGLPSAKDTLNFRQPPFSYPNPWKRYLRPLGSYLALCLLLTALLFFLGEQFFQKKETELRQEYVDLLQLMNKPYLEFENELSKKLSSVAKIENPNLLTQEDILSRVQFLNKEIQSTPELFPLQPNVPRVSDVLAWLTNHPQLQASGKDLVTIENFSYSFLKRPEQTKKQERYQVKVEFEFTSPTPKQAREFHDALIAPNDFVDPKGEVKWSTNRGRYRTSFILKDKTIYPGSS